VPSWSRDPEIGNRLVNARVETLADTPFWRAAFRNRRATVPARGHHEWSLREDGGEVVKQPYYMRVDEQPTLWDEILPDELLVLSAELARVDVLLDDRCSSRPASPATAGSGFGSPAATADAGGEARSGWGLRVRAAATPQFVHQLLISSGGARSHRRLRSGRAAQTLRHEVRVTGRRAGARRDSTVAAAARRHQRALVAPSMPGAAPSARSAGGVAIPRAPARAPNGPHARFERPSGWLREGPRSG
jgi:hypothetical protein